MDRTLPQGAVILAPRGRDAAIAYSVLQQGGIEAVVVPSLPALCGAVRIGVGMAVITEETLRGADLRELARLLEEQGEWSDLPFILLTERGGGLERNPAAVRLLETLGNVTFLERPFHPTTLLSLARSARRARRRQYEARARLEDIREGEARLKLAIAAGGLGAWSFDIATQRLECSDECRAQFGRSPGQRFDYDDLVAAIHDDDREAMQDAVARSIRHGDDYGIEYRTVWPDGSLHWLRLDGRVEYAASGRPARMVGVSEEITAQRRIEVRRNALLTLGDQIRAMSDPDDMALCAAEILGTTLEVSRAGYGVVDRAAETIKIARDWCAPGTQTLGGTLQFRDYGSYIENIKRGELVAIADSRLDERTRETTHALEALHARAVLNMPIVETEGLVALLYLSHNEAREWPSDDLAFVQDVADRTQAAIERRIAEIALAELAATLERQVEERTRERDRTWQNSQDLLTIVGSGGRILAVNPAWTTILGWSALDVVGKSAAAFAAVDDTGDDFGTFLHPSTVRPAQYKNRMRHKDGTFRWVSWIASSEGEHVYASGRHITAEQEAQDALEGAQEQLRQSQKMEAVGQLTGGLAHDFNNLLAAISGSLELMTVRIAQGRALEIDRYISMAQQATKRASALTHRLLAFSRRQTLDPRPTDVNRLIASLDDLLRRSVGPTVDIEIVGAGGLWTTLIDPNQLENAILNLCLNARDAMPDGGTITIETSNKWLDRIEAHERDLSPGQYVSLCVTDTGTGMSAETIERAFDPFFTTKPLGEGTGLGLSMIYGFARQSGGQVRIYSEVGHGTTICLYLPRSDKSVEAEPEHRLASLNDVSTAGGRVLIVDDEPAVRAVVADVLVDLGYECIEAGDGPAGLSILESDMRIDLLVSDVGLPKGMNGRQLADAARVTRPDLKILFITGYAENAVIGNGLLDRGMHVLTKPFSVDALASRIREMIERV
nr:PAS domain-containing protein [Novosphingobium hassiacum]